jgi:hypothetical protein
VYDVIRDASGSVMLVGASDGSVSVLKTLRDGSGRVDFRDFAAHSSPLAGVAVRHKPPPLVGAASAVCSSVEVCVIEIERD